MAHVGELIASDLYRLYWNIVTSAADPCRHKERRNGWSVGMTPTCRYISSMSAETAYWCCRKQRKAWIKLWSNSAPSKWAALSDWPWNFVAPLRTSRTCQASVGEERNGATSTTQKNFLRWNNQIVQLVLEMLSNNCLSYCDLSQDGARTTSIAQERKTSSLASCCHHRPITYPPDNGTQHGKLRLRECAVPARRLRSTDRLASTLLTFPSDTTYAVDRPIQSHHQIVSVPSNMWTLDLKLKEAIQPKPFPRVAGRQLEYLDGRIRNTPVSGWGVTRLNPVSFLHRHTILLSVTGSRCRYCCLNLLTLMIFVPMLKFFVMQSLRMNVACKLLDWTKAKLSSTVWVSIVCWEVILRTVSVVGVPCSLSLVANFSELLGWLQFVWHNAKTCQISLWIIRLPPSIAVNIF